MEKHKKRLPIETFEIPIQKIRRGYYTAVYFWREKQILEELNYAKQVVMQVFQKNDAVLCGTDEAIAVIKRCSGMYKDLKRAYKLFDQYVEQERTIRALYVKQNYKRLERALKKRINLEIELDSLWEDRTSELTITSLYDGDRIKPWETVMTLEGLPQYFAHLESVYLGILARRTLLATNVAKVVEAAQGKPVLFFADRFDHYANQTGDGYAATLSGASGVATDVMGEWWGKKGSGTTPHALIACFEGDTTEATVVFARKYPDVPCISLVDFHNDSVTTAVEVADRFKAEGLRLWGVRLDTSSTVVDQSLIRNNQMGAQRPTGVNTILVNNVRKALDDRDHNEVKIVVSGGFNAEKIAVFEKRKVPVDAYGVGSSLLKGNYDFTADIVMVDGKPRAKVGRVYRPNSRLIKVE
ncbi:quinolinate phosphoribosyl transferase [Patescibacteria group bacterium AH-259-L05]|nr:quinolinate phosphoribosyl transferase [Patescibacteria group bacterium AH-259-L05]